MLSYACCISRADWSTLAPCPQTPPQSDKEEPRKQAAAASTTSMRATSTEAVAVAAPQPYEQRDMRTGGAPEPLSPEMVTLSLLPRAQWQSLIHLEAIKARNK